MRHLFTAEYWRGFHDWVIEELTALLEWIAEGLERK
jgi:hypothetical protein